MTKKADFAIIHAGELATLAGASHKPRARDRMGDLGIIKDGAKMVSAVANSVVPKMN